MNEELKSLMLRGMSIWKATQGKNDQEIFLYCHKLCQKLLFELKSGDFIEDLTPVEQLAAIKSFHGNQGSTLTWSLLHATRWVDDAATQIEIGHKFAASLMATTIGNDVLEDLIFPWKAIVITLPKGLLTVGSFNYTRIRFGFFNLIEGVRTFAIFLDENESTRPASFMIAGHMENFASVDELVKFNEPLPDSPDIEDKEKIIALAKRLVIGCFYTLQYTTNFRERTYVRKNEDSTARQGPPNHRVIFVGKPMAFDCREKIKSYLSSERRGVSPSVQTLVTGHYKRQVIGILKSGRKVIWIEPYWRGPEEAPILSRPRVISN